MQAKIISIGKGLIALSVFFIWLGGGLASAQNRMGKVSGKVTDGTTNQSLAGVSIIPAGSKTGVSTITDGSYIFTAPAGTYTLRFSYTGFQTKEISGIVVKPGESTFLDIILNPSNKELGGVVVTATVKRESQSAVYSKQKLSAAASDGISQEAISKTPDNNAGQILKRVSGVSVQDNRFVVVRGLGSQYNQTMLNGVAMTSTETNQNAFSFDLVPAAVIDNIVVNKTATPDMPGNFAGGVVQVNTKDFPARNFFSIAFQVGYSDQTLGKDFYGGARHPLSALAIGNPDWRLPAEFPTTLSRVNLQALNDQERLRYLRMLPNNLIALNYGPSGLNNNAQLGWGHTWKLKDKKQFGLVAAVTQRRTELIELETVTRRPLGFQEGNIPRFEYYADNTRYRFSSELAGVLNGAYSFGNNKITWKSMYSTVLRDNYIKRDSVFSISFDLPGDEIEGFSFFNERRAIINTVVSGEHKTGKNKETQIEWNVNVNDIKSESPDTRNFLLAKDERSQLYSTNNRGINFTETLISQSRLWNEANDFITGGAFNFTTPFLFKKNKQLIKSGILFQNRRREATGTVLPFRGFIDLALDKILDPNTYNGGPNGMDLINVAKEFTQNSGNYNAGTALQAAYASMENRLGKWKAIWGLRVENYQQSVNVYEAIFSPQFEDPDLLPVKIAARSTTDFLPSLNLIYSPINPVNIRFAASKTVIRPDLRDLAEFPRYDFQTFQVVTGNVNLKSTNVTNLDLKAEWFPSAGEIISASAFYKKMINPIEYAQITAENISINRQVLNTGNATVKGVEMEIRKKLDFIKALPWMEQITVFGNGALIQSRVEATTGILSDFISVFPEHPLTGQPDYIINVGLSVSAFKNSFDATLSYNRTGDHIFELGSSDFVVNPLNGVPLLAVPHFVLRARHVLDLSIRQQLWKKKAQLKFNVTNLLAEPTIIYQDFNGNNRLDNPTFELDKTLSGQGSVISGIDNAASNTIGQRTLSLSFTFTF